MTTRSTFNPKRQTGSEQTIPSISQVLGLEPTLPGEHVDHYQQSLEAIIEELGAKTTLQVYLAEKIHDCLCWIRRYEEQKRATIAVEMGQLAANSMLPHFVRDALLQNALTKGVLKCIGESGYSLQALQQEAIENKSDFLANLDSRIALYTKMLASLQVSYEVTANRKARAQQLILQNALLSRRLDAIEVVTKDVNHETVQEV